MTEERRRHERISHPFEGSWTGASGAAPCRIGDISLSGCFVHSRAIPAVGEATTVTVEIGSHRFGFQGHVIYAEPGMGFGVEFVKITDSEFDLLSKLLAAIRS